MIRPYYNLDDDRGGDAFYGGPSRPRFGSMITRGVKGMMIVCGAVFVFQLILGMGPPPTSQHVWFVRWFGFTPDLAFSRGCLWQFVTYIYLHGDFWHILINLFFLWMIGGRVEMRLGTKRFLWLWFVAGVAGALLQGLSFLVEGAFGDPQVMSVTTLGASGAIMGVAAACAVFYPRDQVYLFFVLRLSMRTFVILIALLNILLATGGGDKVAYLAHLGGLGAGYLFATYHNTWAFRLERLKRRFKGTYGGMTSPAGSTHVEDDDAHQNEVDRILDKIFRESTDSLTDDEKRTLREAGAKYRKKGGGS